MKNKIIKRRTDIDLLRAFAVLSVIFYHFDISGFEGGFLGVDIFFVISGYLITLHIQQQLSESRFSFPYFYLRRIRRLFPALIAIMLICSIAAVFILPKTLLENYSLSQISSSLYISNIFFFLKADYFDTESILKPLLHTWSLSVEEQFYIVWPLFIFFTFTRKPKISIVIIAIISLIAAEIFYDFSPSGAFYLFPFRIFEFAIGAIICGFSSSTLSNKSKNSLLITSILCIFLSVFLSTEKIQNPGLLSLPICIGTALIIFLNHSWLNKQNFITNVFLRIGLVSYSAYLIHWPLVVFYKIYYPEPLSIITSLTLVLITYLLAEVIYNFVEKPALKINLEQNRIKFILLVPLIFCLAYLFHMAQPKLYRIFNPQEYTVNSILDAIPDRRQVLKEIRDEIKQAELKSSIQKTRKLVVIGDSHAVDVSLSLKLLLANSNIEVELYHSICDPLTLNSIKTSIKKLYEKAPQKKSRNPEFCKPYHTEFLQQVKDLSPDIIVFSEAWRPAAVPFLLDSINEIKQETKAELLILGRNPQFSPHPNIIFKNLKNIEEINSIAWKKQYHIPKYSDDDLFEIAKKAQVHFISKSEIVCPDKKCKVLINSTMGYVDGGHWSLIGLKYYGQLLINHKIFKKVIKH